MNGDATPPTPLAGQQPRAPSSALRLLEMFLFAVVFVAGGLFGYLAAFGESPSQTSSGSGLPIPAPALSPLMPGITPLLPDLGLPEFDPTQPGTAPDFGGQVHISNARTEVSPPTGGCSTHIDYIWEIDRGLSSQINGRALIEVDGPGVGGDYHRPVQGNEIRLSLDVTISGSSVFEANVVSVGGVPAFPTPLEASFTDAYC